MTIYLNGKLQSIRDAKRTSVSVPRPPLITFREIADKMGLEVSQLSGIVRHDDTFPKEVMKNKARHIAVNRYYCKKSIYQ